MATFITRRLILLVAVLFGVSLLMFSIMMTFEPERRAAAFVSTPQQAQDLEAIVEAHGLNDPFYLQYFRWIKNLSEGNLGWSLIAAMPVTEAFWTYFPVTLELNLFAAPIVLLLGIGLGTMAGVNRDKPIDHTSRIIAIVGWSLPTFLFALLVLMVFYGYFQLVTPGLYSHEISMWLIDNPDKFTRYTGLLTIDGILNGRLDVTWDAFAHLILPIGTYIFVVVALNMRIMRSSLIEELSKDYVITAKAKGADKRTVNIKHARRNAMLPVLTVAVQLIAVSMEGSVSVEVVFNRPGIGWWLANSALQLDMPVLMAVCMFMGLIFVITSLIVDIMYAVIDPRIRLG